MATITKSELTKALTKLALEDLRFSREDSLHHHMVAQTKVGRVNITYNPKNRTYTMVAQRDLSLTTLVDGVPSREAVAKLVDVYDVYLEDTKVLAG